MRSDRDKRSENEREIDDFLSQFETPVDELNTDVNSYLSWENNSTEDSEFVDRFDVLREHQNDTGDTVVMNKNDYSSDPAPASPYFSRKTEEEVKADAVNTAVEKKPVSKKHSEEKKSRRENFTRRKEEAKKAVANIKEKNLKEKLFLKDNPNYDPSKGSTYMLAGKKIKNTPKLVSAKKILLDIIGLGVAMVLCFILYCTVVIAIAPKYDYHDIYSVVDQSSVILDDEGKQVDQVFYSQNRKIIKYKDMPEDLINSFVAIEDKTFWKHHGFNWVRMAGAVVSSLTGGGRISGTSTITQQLARNVYLADIKSVRSIRRKVLEMHYASRIEHSLTKEEIIEAYLNTIYLGYGCYGVDAASKSYFTKNVKDLDLVECASLAALPQAPEDYALIKWVDPSSVTEADKNIIAREPDTYIANDSAKDRRDLTLQLMLNQGYISQAEYDKSAGKDLIDFINPTFNKGAGSYSYFHEYLVDTLIEDLMEEYDMEYEDAERMVYTKGLKIYSTMDSTAQKTIVKEFKDASNFPSVSGAGQTDDDGNIVSDNGTILLYDYEDFFNEKGNFVFKDGEAKLNSDGSVTVNHGKRLNIFETTSNGETDYSLEFKQTYTKDDGVLYAIPGGYVNIPANYKTLDANENLVISAQFFTDYPNAFKFKDDKIIITPNGYSLPQKTIQPQAAMVVVGVGTGEVKAMVGGRSTKGERLLNRATNTRQPGSSIKPLAVYGAALQKSFELQKEGKKWPLVDFGIDKQGTKGYGDYITTYSSVADERIHVEGRDWPKNSNNAFTGKNTFMTAIQQSINTCAVKIQLQIGADFSADMLEKFGLTTIVTDESQANNDMNPSALALGGMVNGVKPLEMALAYASFPAGGKVNTPICYTKVVDRKGETILEGKSTQSEVMDEGVAWIMTDTLKSVVTRGISGPANVVNVQSGGKTGTTNSQCDIWFDGFTPTYAGALWIGTDNNIPLSTMSRPAAALWGKIMKQVPKACRGEYLPQPANVISKSGCYFTKGTETGLSKYAPDDEKKMKAEAEKRAREAWAAEREAHKSWVVDTAAYDETVTHYFINGAEVSKAEYDAATEGDKTTSEETVHHEEVGHWEYEVGWRDEDFVWDGSIPDDIRRKYGF